MKIGFLRYDKKPPKRARCLFALASLYNVDFFYFRPECVDMQNKKIKGTFFENGGYVERETDYPDIIDDIYSFQYNYRRLYSHLSEYCIFTYVRLGEKSKVYDILSENENCRRYLIDTFSYDDVDIDEILNKYSKVIIKPTGGNKGNNIYRLHKEDDLYVLQLKNEITKLSPTEFNKKYTYIFSYEYLIQQYIYSKTNAGNPFDIRVDVRRGKNGKWKLLKLRPRIGNINVIVSNISQGGSTAAIKDFLPNEFGNDWETVYDGLTTIANIIPPIIQNKYKQIIDALGIDVGIDRDNNNELKIFEINTFPGSTSFDFEVAELSIHFYDFLYKASKAK